MVSKISQGVSPKNFKGEARICQLCTPLFSWDAPIIVQGILEGSLKWVYPRTIIWLSILDWSIWMIWGTLW